MESEAPSREMTENRSSRPAPTISVVIPAHNAGRFLEGCLASVLRQTSPATEIILVDDGSADGTHRHAAVRAGLGGQLVYVKLETNQGPSAARMEGVGASSGEWVAFLDADDRWTANHLEVVRRLIAKVPDADVACTSAAMIGEPILPRSPALEREVMRPLGELMKENFVVQSAVAVRRSTLMNAGGYDRRRRLAEDYDLWVRLALGGTRFAHSTAVTCLRHAHAAQASARLPLNLVQGAWDVRRRAVATLEETGDTATHSMAMAALPIAVEKDLQAAWSTRSRPFIRSVLDVTSWTDGWTESVRRPWTRRIHGVRWYVLQAAATVYDRLPPGMRKAARRLRARQDATMDAATADASSSPDIGG